MANLFIETVVFTVKLIYLLLKGIIVACTPASLCRKKDVSGQIVLITGAGSGLGRLMAIRFAKLKSRLVLWDINTQGNEETAQAIRELGEEAYTYTVDLSSREDIYRKADEVKSDVGDVDILVNNAGIVTGKKLWDCPDSLIEKTMAVNCNAHFWTLKKFLPAMMAKGSGHIVNVASAAGMFGLKGLVDYCASKFAAVGLDESLRMELYGSGNSGVKTTVVCPYYINTGMFEGVKTRFPLIMPIMEPEQVVDKIMTAVLTNQEMLMTPSSVYPMYALKGMLPTSAQALFSTFFGVNNTMNDFVGRAKQD